MRAPRLFLLDGLALAYRGHFAFARRPLLNSRGEQTSALFAFANTVRKLAEDEAPDYWALAWDSDEPTLRALSYAEYKATRKPMPEELVAQLEPLRALAAAIGLPLVEAPGYEADDVMATLTTRARADDLEVVLVTNDKDLQQLVAPGVRVLAPRGRGDEDVWYDEAAVEARWGVPPARLPDVLALMGDASDNVPGVPGIGEKTAAQLIARFGGLDALYERLDEVERASIREALRTHRETAYFSLGLVTVHRDLDLGVTWEQLVARPPHAEHLRDFGARWEIRRLLSWADELGRAALATAGPSPPSRPRPAEPANPVAEAAAAWNVAAVPASPRQRAGRTAAGEQSTLFLEFEQNRLPEAYGPPVRIVDTEMGLEALARALAGAPRGFAVDTETTSEVPMRAQLVGIGVTTGERPAYVPIRHREGRNVPLEAVTRHLGPLLADPSRPKLGQNLKYDALVLAREGLPLDGIAFDTLLASYLLDPEGAHGLDHLSRVHLGVTKIPTSALIGSGRAARRMDEVAIELVAAYCGEDVHCTWLLAERFAPELARRDAESLFREVELPLVPVLVDMERQGVRIDREFLGRMSEELAREMSRLEGLIHAAAGGSFNVNSGPQLATLLFQKLGLPSSRQTKTGLSTGADVLEELAVEHEVPRLVLQYRQVAKLKSTYVDAIPALLHPETGRVHTEFHQTVTATGRLSSSNPGLQNIPMRTALGREIRKGFVAPPGWTLVGADYSQIELRLMAHLSRDAALVEAFQSGGDVHARTAQRIFGLGQQAPSPEERGRAKVVNFGIMYGMGARALSLQLGMPLGQASEFIKDYFRAHAGVRRFLDDVLQQARERGYVSTLLGRRRYLPQLTSPSPRARAQAERAAINTPLQGSAADLVKVAMIRIHDALRREGLAARMVLQVHDELLLESPAGEVERVSEILRHEMTNAVALTVPLEISLGVGDRWFDVH
jgi:DNA polymerase-1